MLVDFDEQRSHGEYERRIVAVGDRGHFRGDVHGEACRHAPSQRYARHRADRRHKPLVPQHRDRKPEVEGANQVDFVSGAPRSHELAVE